MGHLIGQVLWIWAGLATAWVSLAWVRGTYRKQLDDIERDAGWHRMWHERIWDEKHESG